MVAILHTGQLQTLSVSLPSWQWHRVGALNAAGFPGTDMKYGNEVGLAEAGAGERGIKQGAKSERGLWNQNHLDKATNPTGARQTQSEGPGPICSFLLPASMTLLAPEGLIGSMPQRGEDSPYFRSLWWMSEGLSLRRVEPC